MGYIHPFIMFFGVVAFICIMLIPVAIILYYAYLERKEREEYERKFREMVKEINDRYSQFGC